MPGIAAFALLRENDGYSTVELADWNRRAIVLLCDIHRAYESESTKIVISECIELPEDDYNLMTIMSVEEHQQYHLTQINTFSSTEADMATAVMMSYVEEAKGITRVSRCVGLPDVISFTVEMNGKLPNGETRKDAKHNTPVYYVVSCAHLSHLIDTLFPSEPWLVRAGDITANASTNSHAELNDGISAELSQEHSTISGKLENVNVFGGCCRTNHRHYSIG